MSYPREDVDVLERLQEEHGEWAARNGFDGTAEDALLVLVEEVGELARAQVKMNQGIRATDHEWIAKKCEEVGDILISLAGYCNREGISMSAALTERWERVSTRDARSRRPTE